MNRKSTLMLVIPALLAVLFACSPEPATQDPGMVQTNEMETVVASFTRTVEALPSATEALASPTPVPPTATSLALETPTLEPTETPLPSPSPTLTLEDPKTELGGPTWQANFQDPSRWFLFDDDHVKFELDNQTLVMTAYNADGWEGWSMVRPAESDFYLEMTGLSGETCTGRDRYGMIVRATTTNEGYLLGMSCDGHFRLRSYDGETFQTLIDWTFSQAIQTGANQTNRLGFMAQGARLGLYINGIQVAEILDDTFSEGSFGFFISAAATENWTVTVLDALYWDLP